MAEGAAAVQESAGSASASTGEGGVAGGEVAKVTGSDWYIGLPDDLRNDKTVVGFKDKALPEVIKNWKEAQNYAVGAIRLPSERDKPEDADKKMQDIYTKLGRPESPDKYELKMPDKLPEGMSVHEPLAKGFREWAHGAGLNTKQAQHLMDHFNQFQVAQWEATQAGYTAAVKTMEKEWGADFDNMKAVAERAVAKLADAKDVEALQGDLGHNLGLVRILAKVGKLVGEDKAIQANPSEQSSDEAKMKKRLTELRAMPERNNKAHPKYKEIKDEYDGIYKALYGTQPMQEGGTVVG